MRGRIAAKRPGIRKGCSYAFMAIFLCLYASVNVNVGNFILNHDADHHSVSPDPSVQSLVPRSMTSKYPDDGKTPTLSEQSNEEIPSLQHRQLRSKEPSDQAVISAQTNKTKNKPYFIQRGNRFDVTSQDALNLQDHLPPGVYTIDRDMTGFFLQAIDPFEISGKVYGDIQKQSDRIITTFLARSGSTGVLLSGDKGSGKTFLAKFIAVQASRQYGIPTIVINQPLHGEQFNTFVQSIGQPTIFLFDEYEKIYSCKKSHDQHYDGDDDYEARHGRGNGGSPSQDSMLTLLDGTYSSKMLFILTTNDKYRISEHMRNRPGRIFYVIDFAGLPPAFVQEYCEDKLHDRTKIPQLVSMSSLYGAFSFDMLKALVEEMNRYDETPEQALKYLNVRAEFEGGRAYTMKLYVDEEPISKIMKRQWFGNPLSQVVSVRYEPPSNKDNQAVDQQRRHWDPFGNNSIELEFTPYDVVGLEETDDRSFVYVKDNVRLILTAVTERDAQDKSETVLRLASAKKIAQGNYTDSTTQQMK